LFGSLQFIAYGSLNLISQFVITKTVDYIKNFCYDMTSDRFVVRMRNVINYFIIFKADFIYTTTKVFDKAPVSHADRSIYNWYSVRFQFVFFIICLFGFPLIVFDMMLRIWISSSIGDQRAVKFWKLYSSC